MTSINSGFAEESAGPTITGAAQESSAPIIQLKIVYWGPGESGKTTNFKILRNNLKVIKLTNGYSIETTDGRTLWHDSIFLSFGFTLGTQHFDIITQIVTCTGQERFLATREYVLNGADGVIFIGDSDPEKMEQNKRSFRELISFTNALEIPYVIQLNKRDIDGAISLIEFKKTLGLPKERIYHDGTLVVYPAVATKGANVMESFWDLILQVILNYFNTQ
ncbi:MAG: GTP-binding protein [Promethearchaeota archaeon]